MPFALKLGEIRDRSRGDRLQHRLDPGRAVVAPARRADPPGIVVKPTEITGAADALAVPMRGSAKEIADGIRAFRAGGFTQIEVLLWPRTLAALEAMVPVLELLDAD